jgi:acetyltransferase-like isoleucine patch superfamily enzyme
MILARYERLLLDAPRGLFSRFRLSFYRLLGLKAGHHNRLEGIRCRQLRQIELGNFNSLTAGCQLWPERSEAEGIRIRIGSHNYFNRNVMIDACGYVEIGDENMFGPDIYVTDSNHRFGHGISPQQEPMQVGRVKIGNCCWIGARAVILKNVELGDHCVVGAGAVVTKSFPAGSIVAGVPARLIGGIPETLSA